MALPSRLGLRLEIEEHLDDLRPDEFLFSETGGFLIEVAPDQESGLEAVFASHGVPRKRLGQVRQTRELAMRLPGGGRIALDLDRLEVSWREALRGVMQ